MSSAVGSAKQTNIYNEENEALYDPYLGFAVNNLCADVLWPEWIDTELNTEAWDEGKGKTATAAGPKGATATTSSPVFDDPQPLHMPPSISGSQIVWKRPQEVFPGAVFTVYDPTNVDFQLRLPSTLSSKCNFFKDFVEQLVVLQFYAHKYGFQVEMETSNFVANTQGDTWRPWHHIYAMCKAGKGQVHKPLYCPYGKYVLRLFYMGMWRRFVVDDKIPCDGEGNCILPISQIAGELWPIILTKGILKILSLTPAKDISVVDFPLVSAFTGWIQGYISTENKTSEQVWRRLEILVPRYEQPERKSDDWKSVSGFSKNTNAKKESSKKESRKSQDREESQGQRFCYLFGKLVGFSFKDYSAIDSTVVVTMTRDTPLIKVNKREGTKPWKRIRWIYWAKEKGLWVDENQLPPYRRVQIITFFQELSELLTPDPKLEAALYDIPIEDDSGAEDELSTVENPLKVFEPEQWCDYFRFFEYLFGVNVFFKPSYFISNFKVSCLKEKVAESPRAAKGTSKPLPSQNVFTFSTILKPTYNEPMYLLCEALTGIFVCISLWVCPQKEKTFYGYLDSDQPEILKVGHASLLVEEVDWRVVSEGEVIGFVKTVGYSSVVLNLKPGRHVLKLWLYSDSSYLVDINSNVNVVISKSPKIRFLMNTESQQILQYIHNVSNSFLALTQKYGKPDLATGLREFYETIKPKNDCIVGYYSKLDEFIENFLNCILLTLKDIIPQMDEVMVMMWTLRALFLNPDIRCEFPIGVIFPSLYGAGSAKKPPAKPVSCTKERTLSQLLDWASIPENVNKVITIQRIFRGFRVRLLWKYQSPLRKEFKPFTDRLKKICDLMFVPPKRETEVGKLLRKVVMNKPELLTTFRFHKDFANVVQVEEFTGKVVNVEPFAWVPIARFVVACHCEDLVPAAFYLSCNLEQSVIQCFDNDSGQEIFRVANTVSPHYYHSNVRGYTILVFGWNEANIKTVNWRLEMVKMKHFQSLHLCNLLTSSYCHPYNMPTLDLFEIKNFYIPNTKSRILRCLIKIQKRTLLTMRLSLSFPCVHFVVVLTLDERFCESSAGSNSDPVLAEVSSTNGGVILPSLVLEYVECPWDGESSEFYYTVYVLEAYVLNNSWPLTKQEWGLVEPIRVNGENWKESTTSIQSKRGGSESRRKLNRTSRRNLTEQKVENPYWLLQTLNDAAGSDSGDAVIIEEDKSYAESVKAMKLKWEEKDIGRRKRGREMRMKFLHAMYIEQKKGTVLYGEDMYGEEMSLSEDVCEDPQAIVDRLSSFTYLINDPSPTRYICSPRILPAMPLKELLCKYKKATDDSTACSEGVDSKDNQFSNCVSQMSLKVVGELIWEMEEERQDFLRQCLHYRNVLSNWLNEEQKLSNLLMEQAYETRANLLERMTR